MICPRCGIINRPDRISCVHCWGPVVGLPSAADARCVDHPQTAATGRCTVCGKLVCDNCGGLYKNSVVYCVEHTEAAMMGELGRGGKNSKPKGVPVPPVADGGEATKKRGLFAKRK